MAGDDGEINGAALGDLAHGAATGALGDAGKQSGAGGIAEGLEEGGIEEVIERAGARGGESRRGGRTALAYLRHGANICRAPRRIKGRSNKGGHAFA